MYRDYFVLGLILSSPQCVYSVLCQESGALQRSVIGQICIYINFSAY